MSERRKTQNPFDNQDFRKEFEESLDKQLRPITELVTKHEAALNQAKGAKWAFALVWAFFMGAVDYLVHRVSK